MHIKFLEHGTGQVLDAVEYLLAVTDAKGERRAGVDILRGDLYQLASLADSLDFKYRYSSGVVSFHPDDMPTDKQLEALIDDFEKTAFAGLDPEQYCWGVVRHDDNLGGFHLHIIIARVELRTGKSFNPAPPGWQKTFDPLRIISTLGMDGKVLTSMLTRKMPGNSAGPQGISGRQKSRFQRC